MWPDDVAAGGHVAPVSAGGQVAPVSAGGIVACGSGPRYPCGAGGAPRCPYGSVPYGTWAWGCPGPGGGGGGGVPPGVAAPSSPYRRGGRMTVWSSTGSYGSVGSDIGRVLSSWAARAGYPGSRAAPVVRRAASQSSGSRAMGHVMQCPPPRPRPSSAPTIVTTSTPARRSAALVRVLRS